MKAEEKAINAWAVYEYREHPQGLYHTCFIDGFKQGYEQAEKDLGWISVKDRLPEKSGYYITCVEQAGVAQCVGVTYFDTKEWTDDDDSTELVDYWMPIPKLPKDV